MNPAALARNGSILRSQEWVTDVTDSHADAVEQPPVPEWHSKETPKFFHAPPTRNQTVFFSFFVIELVFVSLRFFLYSKNFYDL